MKLLHSATATEQLIEEQKKLGILLNQQEIYWKQRAKQFWLREGDTNTRYFHHYASLRRKRNSILKLRDDTNQWKCWDSGLEQVKLNYFQDLFKLRGSKQDATLRHVQRRVSAAQNETLLSPFEAWEIKKAVFYMYPDKALGPDSMNPSFFQHFLNITGSHVTESCLDYLNNCYFPNDFNKTTIVLIPKVKKPERMSELRPISLCNVIYKVVAKVIANWLKLVLPTVISDTQSAFVPNRLISDNIMVAFEVGHYLKRKRQGNVGYAALKLDMSKAYDRLEWDFLRAMMLQLGFDERWVKLIMLCVITVEYMVIQDGHDIGPTVPQRGLRQGDPLSPYLFILRAKGLSNLLHGYSAQGLIHGCRVARTAPEVSHLFFADDSYIFFRARGRKRYG